MQQSLVDPTASTNNQLQSEYKESSMRNKLKGWAEILSSGVILRIVELFSQLESRGGIIWILIFTIPVAFASMIHDSYKNFLPDSWFTKTFDHVLIFSVAT